MTPQILMHLRETLLDLIDEKDLEYADNFRYADTSDPDSMANFEEIADSGCCGSFDTEVTLDGKTYLIGCNHGH